VLLVGLASSSIFILPPWLQNLAPLSQEVSAKVHADHQQPFDQIESRHPAEAGSPASP
jgi:hypothetical protein